MKTIFTIYLNFRGTDVCTCLENGSILKENLKWNSIKNMSKASTAY